MEGPIYKFYRVRWTEAYYQLSQTERDSLLAKIGEMGKQFGVKLVVLCDSAWSNERWTAFGVEEFPDMATVQKHNAALAKVDRFCYIECETMLGTAVMME